ncbi:MAG: type II secretion system F family protein [Bryobacteraceae bacterium]|jgi:tight adherence protein C
MAIAVSICFFVLVAVSIMLFGYRLYARPAQIHERLGAAVVELPLLGQTSRTETRWLVRVIQQIGEKVPISPQDATVTRRFLIAAGFRTDMALKMFYGIKLVACGLLLLAAVVGRHYIGNPILSIIVLPAGALAGFYGPNLVLEKMIDRRRERLRHALPDALDLMVVCMEAGLGLDQAIANVSRELLRTHKDISEEFGLVNLEMRAGKRRGEALKNLADRCSESELRKLVATMIQADRFGTSIAEALRTHADFMRVKRRQEAEERAGKVGVKLVFPIFFCILPSMLLVAAGPGLLQLFKGLFPMMNSFGK